MLAYESLVLPKDAPFTLKPSPGKGWGAFATRPIKKGETILHEKPLYILRNHPEEIFFPWDIMKAYQQLKPKDKQIFQALGQAMGVGLGLLDMVKIHELNQFDIKNDNGCRESALYPLHSRFNHSCVPNSRLYERHMDDTDTRIAIENIPAGEEITFCYSRNLQFMTALERHQDLEFTCTCKACLPGTPFQRLSDARRRLMRGLHNLIQGVDISFHGDNKQSSKASVFLDPKVERKAKEFRNTVADRYFYMTLMCYLLEQEGLLENGEMDYRNRDIAATARQFRTLSNLRIVLHVNLRIVLHVTDQTSWLKKLEWASRLYGRKDDGDGPLIREIRRIAAAGGVLKLKKDESL